MEFDENKGYVSLSVAVIIIARSDGASERLALVCDWADATHTHATISLLGNASQGQNSYALNTYGTFRSPSKSRAYVLDTNVSHAARLLYEYFGSVPASSSWSLQCCLVNVICRNCSREPVMRHFVTNCCNTGRKFNGNSRHGLHQLPCSSFSFLSSSTY